MLQGHCALGVVLWVAHYLRPLLPQVPAGGGPLHQLLLRHQRPLQLPHRRDLGRHLPGEGLGWSQVTGEQLQHVQSRCWTPGCSCSSQESGGAPILAELRPSQVSSATYLDCSVFVPYMQTGHNYLTEEEMAAEINNYPAGTVRNL